MSLFTNSAFTQGSSGGHILTLTIDGSADKVFSIVTGFEITRFAAAHIFYVDGGVFSASNEQVANDFAGRIVASDLFTVAQGTTGATIYTGK